MQQKSLPVVTKHPNMFQQFLVLHFLRLANLVAEASLKKTTGRAHEDLRVLKEFLERAKKHSARQVPPSSFLLAITPSLDSSNHEQQQKQTIYSDGQSLRT